MLLFCLQIAKSTPKMSHEATKRGRSDADSSSSSKKMRYSVSSFTLGCIFSGLTGLFHSSILMTFCTISIGHVLASYPSSFAPAFDYS